jgi:phosphoribosylanthranilate isomerase
MFTVKICGITRPEDAQAAAAAGADAIGLNFYEKSPRFIDAARARAIIAALPLHVIKVGVFVNARAEKINCLFDELKLDLIQLHGDEPARYLLELNGRPVMKAFGSESKGMMPKLSYLAACKEFGCMPRLVLLDSPRQRLFGGSGNLAYWPRARSYIIYRKSHADAPPLVLAGGLRPENVAEAIRSTHVRAVDTASGVESQAGIKDSAAIAAFVTAAKGAFKLLGDESDRAG